MSRHFPKPYKPEGMEHIIVYRNDGEYAGWPFNGGLWRFGNNELVVGFNSIGGKSQTP